MKRKTKKASEQPVRKVPISATLLPEQRDRLAEIARAEHRDLSQLIRIAIDEFLQRRERAA